VLNVKINTSNRTPAVSFDPEKTNVERLIGALEADGFKVKGSPQFLK
jgi:copper chaperone CopZ